MYGLHWERLTCWVVRWSPAPSPGALGCSPWRLDGPRPGTVFPSISYRGLLVCFPLLNDPVLVLEVEGSRGHDAPLSMAGGTRASTGNEVRHQQWLLGTRGTSPASALQAAETVRQWFPGAPVLVETRGLSPPGLGSFQRHRPNPEVADPCLPEVPRVAPVLFSKPEQHARGYRCPT